MKKVQAIILAGGHSSRMGADKGLLMLNNKPMIKHLIDLLDSLKISASIISNNEEYHKFGLPVFGDLVKDKGPLGGLLTGLQCSNTKKIVVLSCDTPLLKKETLQLLIDSSGDVDITLARSMNKLHPLIGVYSKNCIPLIEKQLEYNDLKMLHLIEKMNYHVLDLNDDPDQFMNINTASDMEIARQTIPVRFFGLIAEKIGTTVTEIEIPEQKEPLNLRTFLNNHFPILEKLSYKIALDLELKDELNPGQAPKQIAILPPFAGG